MRYNWILFGLSILLSFTCLSPGMAQTPMQITNYNYKNYKGGIQNWGIAISPEQILYSSNNNGLLRYNGNDWALLEPGGEVPYVRSAVSGTGFTQQATTTSATGNMM